jgi:hypothetical protein
MGDGRQNGEGDTGVWGCLGWGWGFGGHGVVFEPLRELGMIGRGVDDGVVVWIMKFGVG